MVTAQGADPGQAISLNLEQQFQQIYFQTLVVHHEIKNSELISCGGYPIGKVHFPFIPFIRPSEIHSIITFHGKLSFKEVCFTWTASLGKILAMDNLWKNQAIIVDWC